MKILAGFIAGLILATAGVTYSHVGPGGTHANAKSNYWKPLIERRIIDLETEVNALWNRIARDRRCK